MEKCRKFYHKTLYSYATVIIRNTLSLGTCDLSVNAENSNDCIFFFLLLKSREKQKKEAIKKKKETEVSSKRREKHRDSREKKRKLLMIMFNLAKIKLTLFSF